MKTKLVYVLTCEPEATYIEQALMAVWSARYWNPDAHIVLLTDNKTSALLHAGDARGEILQYISDEVVTSFDEDKNMHYRSRWLKTKARELVKGDMLFIDCDTICCKSLESIDSFDCEVGAVPDSHLPISEYNDDIFESIESRARVLGWDIRREKYYFSSGVFYSKDIAETHELYRLWHITWIKGIEQGVFADQPSLAYANIQCGHIIKKIPDSYNHILYTEFPSYKEAYILHITAYRNPSILFENKTLENIKKNGLSDSRLRELVLNPSTSFRPFDYEILHSTFKQRLNWINSITKLENSCISSIIWMIKKRIHVFRHKDKIKDNICRKRSINIYS